MLIILQPITQPTHSLTDIQHYCQDPHKPVFQPVLGLFRKRQLKLRPFHTRPKNRIQCASNAHSLCSHLNLVLGDAHWMHIESIHLWRWIRTESEPNSLFIHRITIKSRMVPPPQTATSSKLSRLGHHTRCICHPRYELRWPIMLGRHWLDAVEKETAYQVVSCSSSKFTFHIKSTTATR